MTKKDFIEKWNVAYESKEQQIEFAMEMLVDLMLVIEDEHEQCGVLRKPDPIKSLLPCICEGAFGENENCPSCYPVSLIGGG